MMGIEVRQVDGFVGNREAVWKGKVMVTVTSSNGEDAIMLQEGNARIGVPLKGIEKMIEKARKKR